MKDRVTSHYIVSPNHDEVSSYNEVLETNYPPPPPLINIYKKAEVQACVDNHFVRNTNMVLV